ncbi:FapA family protein [Halalkalibacterium ligniniphilum]|uniref:FapA family protein n=1 Tax=Halalkalibacterium ligniniphilum TaxID=1134413 RepID=UPI000349FAC1|nr:FapA family protein [Halalkalibacterium ligniniphilum]
MANSVLLKGKSVAEAVEMALEMLQATRDQVDIEILEEGGKRRFGLGNKLAVVKVTKRNVEALDSPEKIMEAFNLPEKTESPSEEPFSMIDEEDLSGLVWVKDGQIFCRDKSDSYPMIEVGADVKLYRNGELIEGLTIVLEQDQLMVEFNQERVETVWSLEIDDLAQKVTLHVKPGYQTVYSLVDQPPARKITLHATKSKIPVAQLQKEDVLKKVNELGITYGLDMDLIEHACQAKEEGTYVVAQGIEPKDGEDGTIEFNVEVDYKELTPQVKEDGTVDFRETKYIPTVEEGTVLGVVGPPKPAKKGINVFGEDVDGQPGKPLIVRTGKGTMFVDDKKLVAIKSGRPEVKRQGLLIRASVMPRLYHSGDVNIATGNIRFTGDVEIQGSVEDNMLVHADGNIIVNQHVLEATLQAGNSINVRHNLINSEVTAGRSNLLVAELGHLLGDISEQLTLIIKAIEQLNDSNAFRDNDTKVLGLSSILKLLLEQKFKSFLPLVKKFVTKVNENQEALDEEWQGLAKRFRTGFLTLHPEGFKDIEDIRKMGRFVKHVHQISILPPEPNSELTCSYAMNSNLYCSGNIIVKGKGVYNSKVYTGSRLEIDGVLIGGEAFARCGARLGTVGSKAGASTKISVPNDQHIMIDHVMENTTIQVGKRVYKFSKEAHYINARLGEDGHLLLN